MKPIDIAPADLETVRCILREHVPELEVHAFGSRVSWTARETSDLDVALLTEEPLSIARVTNLKAAFTKSYLPFRVDIVDWASTSENFRKVIAREHVVLVECHRTIKLDGWRKLQFGEAFQVNPRVHLKRGNVYPFVSMAVVDTNSRDTYAVERRKFSSGGSRFAKGDTLMARITPCLENGKITRFCSSDLSNFGHGSTEFIVIRGTPNLTDNEFAYYLTRSEQVRSYAIKQMTGTSGRQRVPTDSLIRLIVSIPPLSEQRSIAQILRTLDDKIELNHRMNKTLEEIAQALFKSWFIDFEPVKAKLAVLEKGGTSDEAERAAMCAISTKDEITLAKLQNEQPVAFAKITQIAAQFPSNLQYGELGGGVPEGWKIKLLRECFDLTMGQSPPSISYNDNGDGLPFFQGCSDFRSRFPTNRKYCSKPMRIAQEGDTLFSVRAPVGDINMAWQTSCIGRGVAAIRHKSNSCSFTYYFAWAIQKIIVEYEDTGTVFGSINKNQFETVRVLEPNFELIEAFDNYVSSLDLFIRANTSEIRILSELRDTMLSKLLSGEVRVQEF